MRPPRLVRVRIKRLSIDQSVAGAPRVDAALFQASLRDALARRLGPAADGHGSVALVRSPSMEAIADALAASVGPPPIGIGGRQRG
jgi:hypothetical protein